MDAIPFFMGKQVFETGEIVLPAGEGRASFLPREEMAEAAVNVLISKGNEGKPYNISNIYSYDYMEISDTLSDISGKEISYHPVSIEEYINNSLKVGIPQPIVDMVAVFSSAQAAGDFDVPSIDIEILLGRKPSTMKSFMKTFYQNLSKKT